MALSMRFLAGGLALGMSACVYAACESGAVPNDTTTTFTSTATGSGGGSSCFNHQPDGWCVSAGANVEGCDCEDCTAGARCGGHCTDDGTCDPGSGEDCSCPDCYLTADFGDPYYLDCTPGTSGCDDDDGANLCTFNEPCVCPDCTATAFCMDNCVDNGTCVAFSEGCACADCAGEPECGGSTTSSTTTTTSTGGGGAGGTSSGGGGAGGT